MKSNKNYQSVIPPQDDKIIPSCVDVEKTLIAQLLIDGEIMAKTSLILRPEMFYDVSLQNIYIAIEDLFENSIGINMITVIDKLRKLSLLESSTSLFSSYPN